jgi:homogentisate 1,2-dioxygenase
MPSYVRVGEVPRKRHTVFRHEDGRLRPEQLVGNMGFVGPSSLLYHRRPPTTVVASRVLARVERTRAADEGLRLRHFFTGRLSPGPDPVRQRVPLLFNDEVALSLAAPGAAAAGSAGGDSFYRNADGDEILYVAQGGGVLESQLGCLPYRRGDYLVVPRGILYRLRPDASPQRLLVIESRGFVRTPRRYRNEYGQHLEHSPFCERDFRVPEEPLFVDETGRFPIVVKKGNVLNEVVLDHHPCDVLGWDGYYYPWAFNIEDFEPIVGRLHQPPPVHQTFEGDGFVVCSFVPRPFDFHPEAIPAPYNHANVMSDEVIFYASDEFMSRKGIEFGSLTWHPDGLPHGPHPGTVEAAIGKKATAELAVMVDTFRPLHVAAAAVAVEDPDYWRSWSAAGGPGGEGTG